ncbi:MAG: peptidase U32 family protein [Thermodesulfobacteriota bacterium]|nr:peptidase U32 family protein [Thermodesulfobacteriota bacterium]
MESKGDHKPLILAPAGNREAFMAALAAGADALYCGLKSFSARMKADNFTPAELARLVTFAHEKGSRVYVALNTLIKPDELQQAYGLVRTLARHIRPDGLIVQDLGAIELAAQAGFTGEIHLSTLAAVTFSGAFDAVHRLGVHNVVLPREFTIDEIKKAAAACPAGMRLEVFVHGALCYGVSGRCYWSSYMGGKSGLRGRCVQPCRRMYAAGKDTGRFFSCLDFSVDVLVKTLLPLKAIAAWKIEGRKKGPHYVYYTTTAYKLLRDEGTDPKAKQAALGFLEQALGRKTTHYHFLPQRSFSPANTGDHTASGMLVGRIRGGGKNSHIVPSTMLLAGDLLRIGYEDQPGHQLYRPRRFVPKRGRLHVRLPGKLPPKAAPVFLIDRLEPALADKVRDLEVAFEEVPETPAPLDNKKPKLPKCGTRRQSAAEMHVYRTSGKSSSARDKEVGIWLSPKATDRLSGKQAAACWWWLPPVIWETDAAAYAESIAGMIARGARRFVANAPWQIAFFDSRQPPFEIWAGPFCNQTNCLSIKVLAGMGFSGVVVSPELEGPDFLRLPAQSMLPLGVVVTGNWPLCLSRIKPEGLAENLVFSSPKKENAWLAAHDQCYWVYPDWRVDLSGKRKQLADAGYVRFFHLVESLPGHVTLKKRPGMWNWDAGLA